MYLWALEVSIVRNVPASTFLGNKFRKARNKHDLVLRTPKSSPTLEGYVVPSRSRRVCLRRSFGQRGRSSLALAASARNSARLEIVWLSTDIPNHDRSSFLVIS